jgi:hypothetical protein
MTLTQLSDAMHQIEDLIDESGPLSAYEIGIIVRDIALLLGNETANELISEFKLEEIGIRKLVL